MGQEVEKFDPSTLMQGVKDRIKATFVSLIPDGQWEVMVQKEIDEFFKPVKVTHAAKKKTQYSGYGYSGIEITSEHITEESPFRRIIWQLCEEKTVEVLKEKLREEWFGNNWPITEENMKENLKKVVIESVPVGMVKFFETLAFAQTNRLREEIQNFR